MRPPHSLLILWQHFGFLSSWVRPLFEAIFFSDQRFQNRYFPMTWQFWQITGQCLVFPPGLRGILTVAHKISFICSVITNYQRGEFIRPSTALYFCSRRGYELHCVPDVRIVLNEHWTSSPFSCSLENRCDKTSFYSLVVFLACTLLAQVVLTVRSGVPGIVQ